MFIFLILRIQLLTGPKSFFGYNSAINLTRNEPMFQLLLPMYNMPRKMNSITEATYDSWKRVRSILSPTFSAARMKEVRE